MQQSHTIHLNSSLKRTLKAWGRSTWNPKFQVPHILASPNMETKSQLLSLKKPWKQDFIIIKTNLILLSLKS